MKTKSTKSATSIKTRSYRGMKKTVAAAHKAWVTRRANAEKSAGRGKRAS